MTIDRLIMLLSHTKVEALVVYHMISCFPAISLRFMTLMICSVDGVERLTVLAVQPHIDVMASLLFVNINGIPVMYAVF